MERHFFCARCLALLCGILLSGTISAEARQAEARSSGTAAAGYQPGIYLVFPFENAGASPRLEWLGEGLEELTIQRLSAAGEQVYSHAGRLVELERYGLPHASKFSRAMMLRIAEEVDADYVIFGKYASNGTTLRIESRMLRVNPTALLPEVGEKGPLDSVMDLQTRVVWRLLSSGVRRYPLSLAEFTKRQRALRLDAFEHYIRGLLANDDELRLRDLHEAARLEPEWPDPDFAIGEVYYSRRDYNSALAWFFKIPKSHDRYVEAMFASGVCRLSLDQLDRAEETFTSLQEALRNSTVTVTELPEVLNDLAIVRARQGKVPAAENDLRRAAELDPDEGDYFFNLGLLSLQRNDAAAAAEFFRDAGEREPDNPEDRALLIASLDKEGKKPEAEQERGTAAEAFGPNGLPAVHVDAKGDSLTRLQRIKTELDLTALRVGIELSGTPASVAASAVPEDSPVAHNRRGRQELSAGRADAAEKEFRAALAADPGNAAAHRGLGEIDRRQGKIDDAIKELQTSLDARDSAVVRTMLGKIYLEQKKNDLARAEFERALKLAPNYAEAKQLLEHLQNSKPAAKKPGGGAP